MFDESGVVERSLRGFPGHISAIVSVDGKEKLHNLKENLLKDNPMVSALFLNAKNWENCKELAEWAKKNNLQLGLGADEMKLEEIRAALESGFIDFVRLEIKNHPEIKKKAGIIRNSGIKHEFVFGLHNDDLSKAEEAYLLVSPCDSFVVEAHPKINDETRENLMGLSSKYKSMVLRLLK